MRPMLDPDTGKASPAVPFLSSRLQGFGVTIFAEMSALAARTGAINLGQGFPDQDGPQVMVEAAVRAMREGHNQYPPGAGIPELRQAVARHQQRFYGLAYDPDTEVLVTAGGPRRPSPPPCGPCVSPTRRWSSSSRSTTLTRRPWPWPVPAIGWCPCARPRGISTWRSW